MAFSSSDVAFEGFRLTREKPKALAAWAGLQLLGSILFSLVAVTLLGADMRALEDFNANRPQEPEAVLAVFPTLLKVLAVGLPVRLIVWSLLVCAIYRAVLRPRDGGFGFIRFGGDEGRQMMLSFVVGLILFAAMMGSSIVLVLMAMGVGLLVSGGANDPGTATLVAFLAMAGMIAVYVWLLVRLSLTGPMTFVRDKLSIVEAWKLTRGNFWRLLGSYFIAIVLAIVVALLGGAIMMAVAMLVGGGWGAAGQAMNPSFASLEDLLSPTTIVVLLFSAVLNAVQTAITMAPSAVAFRELSGEGTVETFA